MVIQEYQDPKVKKYLRYGFWYQEHNFLVNKVVYGFLWATVVIIWLICFFNIYKFVWSQITYNKFIADLTLNRVPVLELHQARAPIEPKIGGVIIMAGTTATQADFVAYAENENPAWYIELEYIISWEGGQTVTQTALLLPQTKTVLMARGATVNNLPLSANLTVTSKKWQRIKSVIERERIASAQKNIIIDSPIVSNESNITQVFYTVANKSLYNWLTPRFAVILLQGENPVAVGMNEVPVLTANEEVKLEYRWVQALGSNLTVAVYPFINPLQKDSYSLPTGDSYAL